MAIQFPPSIQLEQDPYVKSRAGFNSYLEFIKEQKERVTGVRMMAQQKKLLAEQRQEKMQDLSYEYYLRGMNEENIQNISSQQARQLQLLKGEQDIELENLRSKNRFVETAFETNAATIKAENLAETKRREDIKNSYKKSQEEAVELQKQIVKEYGSVLPYAGLSGFNVGVDFDFETGLYELVIPYGDKNLTQQDVYNILEENREVYNFVKLHEDWQNTPGEKSKTNTIGTDMYLGADEESQEIMSILKNPQHPEYDFYKNEVKSGKIKPTPSQVEGTAAVEAAQQTLLNYNKSVEVALSNLEFDETTRLIVVKERGFFGSPEVVINFNKPISQIQADIRNAVKNVTDEKEKQKLEDLNKIITEYSYEYRRMLDPKNPDITSLDDLYFDPVKKRIEVNKKQTRTVPSSSGTPSKEEQANRLRQ